MQEKLFSLGPVEMFDATLRVKGRRLPYFRTSEFSQVNLNIANLLKTFVYTSQTSEVITLTASGSAAMEATIMNIFNKDSKVLVVNGGSFGQRFCNICKIHNINYTEIKLNQGETLKLSHLEKFQGKDFDGILINAHETSTGVYHNLKEVGEFCKQHNMLLIVDAISSFLADEYYMDKWNIDVTILSSQKALALSPGLSFIIINNKVKDIVYNNKVKSLYFDLKLYIENMKRGQTPFTPAVGIILELENALNLINDIGVNNIVKNTRSIAEDFRNKIKELPFNIPSESMSNACTPLMPIKSELSAWDIFVRLKQEFNIIVCPNGGELRESLFRVGHIGNLSIEDNDELIRALKSITKL